MTSSQLKRPRAMVHTVSDNSSSMGDAAERLDVLFGLLLDHVGDVVEGDDADQPVVGVHHRRRHQIVALEQPRHFLLVLVGVHGAQIGLPSESLIGTGRLLRSSRSSGTAPR